MEEPLKILVTGASGFVGSGLIPRLRADGHRVRAFARDPARVSQPGDVPVHVGDVLTGAGLDAALESCDVAYFLVHSMEPGDASFADRDRRAAREFALATRRAGVRRVVYLGGLVPADGAASPHLASRLEVEEILLNASPESVALRASIVIAARSRSFRFLVRIVERLPVLALPAWRDNRTQPIDGRDVLEFLARAATVPEASGRSLDIAGPDVLTYGEMVERIRDLMLLPRPSLNLERNATGIASRVGAVIAGEDHDLVGPLMAGLTTDLLPRDDTAPGLLGVRLHRFDAAVERALRDWEEREPLAAR
jgi:uncharacterized protein YbjT (DUF2867 family)